MAFASQKEFNRFMGNYIDRLPRSKGEAKPAEEPEPEQKPADKAEKLVEKELDKVEDFEDNEGFFEKVRVFFFGREPLKEDVREVSEVEDYIDDVAPQPAQQPVARARFASASFEGAQRLAAAPLRRIESFTPLAKRFEYSPDSEKDIKYLTSLIESLIGKINYPERDKFLKSSEYRIYQDVKLRHR